MTTLAASLAACGDVKTECSSGACSNTGGASSTTDGPASTTSSGAPASCHIDVAAPGGPFTFHVHNGSSTSYDIALGCGATIPIDLVTSEGLRSIGPGAVNGCEYICDAAGMPPLPYCSDCGPGVSKTLARDATVDIPWDFRVFSAYTVDPSCNGGSTAGSCALAKSVPVSSKQEGVLTVCSTAPSLGHCAMDKQIPFKFTVDTSGSEATIEVK